MRRVCAPTVLCGALAACVGGDDTEPPVPTVTIEVVDTSPAATKIVFTWSPDVARKAVDVDDFYTNRFWTPTHFLGDRVEAIYRLPPQREFAVLAGYLNDVGVQRTVAVTRFTTKAEAPCDRATIDNRYTAMVRGLPSPYGAILAGPIPSSRFLADYTPKSMPNQYVAIIDNANKTELPPGDTYYFLPDRTYTYEVGWRCEEESPPRRIPLASTTFIALSRLNLSP